MLSIGVRKLKEQASRILNMVQEQGIEVEITHRGRAIARLVPASPRESPPAPAGVWSDLDRLAAEIDAHWPAGASAEDAVRQQRREL